MQEAITASTLDVKPETIEAIPQEQTKKANDEITERKEEKKEEKKEEIDPELIKNKMKELDRKNEKLSEYQKKIDEYEARDKDEREKDMKKKGKLEELLWEKEDAIKELSKYKEFYTVHEEKRTKELNSKIETLPSERKEMVEKLLARAESIDEKHDIIDVFVSIEEKETFWKQPQAKQGQPTNKQSEYKTKWDILWMIANAPAMN